MKSIQNELDCIEESGYAKFLAIEITRARYALQVSANSFDKIIPPSLIFIIAVITQKVPQVFTYEPIDQLPSIS